MVLVVEVTAVATAAATVINEASMVVSQLHVTTIYMLGPIMQYLKGASQRLHDPRRLNDNGADQ